MRRRSAVFGLVAMVLAPSWSAGAATTRTIEVFKSPTCGCCAAWVKHLESNGFQVTVQDVGNAAARARLGIPVRLGSCHTGVVGGYAIEGHVPAREIERLLKEKPVGKGLAVPGMPIGSPGMEQGRRREAYDVLLVHPDGATSVFAAYAAMT